MTCYRVGTVELEEWKLEIDFKNSGKLEFLADLNENRLTR